MPQTTGLHTDQSTRAATLSSKSAPTDTIAFRLTEILRRLNEGKKLDPHALVTEFGVNLRTIQRDLNDVASRTIV